MLKDCVNSRQQGDIGLGCAIGWLTSQGYTVSIPLTDSQDYDLVAEMSQGLCKVQVKTSHYERRPGKYEVSLCTSGGNKSGTGKLKEFNPESVDYLFVLLNDGRKYLIPSGKVSGTRKIMVGGEKYEAYLVA